MSKIIWEEATSRSALFENENDYIVIMFGKIEFTSPPIAYVISNDGELSWTAHVDSTTAKTGIHFKCLDYDKAIQTVEEHVAQW